jgi:hypothetical protein
MLKTFYLFWAFPRPLGFSLGVGRTPPSSLSSPLLQRLSRPPPSSLGLSSPPVAQPTPSPSSLISSNISGVSLLSSVTEAKPAAGHGGKAGASLLCPLLSRGGTTDRWSWRHSRHAPPLAAYPTADLHPRPTASQPSSAAPLCQRPRPALAASHRPPLLLSI